MPVQGLFLALVLSTQLGGAANGPAAAPKWAAGLDGWGILDVPSTVGRRDLELLRLEFPGTFVAQDRKDHIYVLSFESGSVQEFTPNGDLVDAWIEPEWKALGAIPGLSAFAVDRRGTLFAAATRGTVRLFNREKVLAEVKLPTLVTGLAFAKGELIVARLPLESGTFDGGQFTERPKPALVSRLDMQGKVLGDALEPDRVEGPDVFSAALTAAVAIASDPTSDDQRAWIADRHRLYRVRRLASSGDADASSPTDGAWKTDQVTAPVSFEGPEPEEITKKLKGGPIDLARPNSTKPRQVQFQAIDAAIVARSLVARDGLLFVLIEQGAVADKPVIDVITNLSDGPAWRFALDSPVALTFSQLAVTEGGFWLFPVAAGSHPTWVERIPDMVLLQPPPVTKRGETAPPPPHRSHSSR